MAFPTKPTVISLQPGHAFANGLVAAWLFADGSGTTITDYAATPHNLTVTAGSGGTWGQDGPRQTFMAFDNTAADVGSDVAALKFTSSEAWSIGFWCRRTAAGSGSKQRLMQRVGDLQDIAWDSSSFNFQEFNGSSWRDSGVTATLNAARNLIITRLSTDSHLHIYVDGVEALDEGNTGVAQTGAITIGRAANNDQYIQGDISSIFIHNRALSQAEITAHQSDPYAAFTAPTAAAVAGPRIGFNGSLQGGSTPSFLIFP